MKTIGQRLKYRRESLGMTLQDIERKIKVQRKYIEMIEKNDFDALPNKNYVTGIIEKYARSVNMSPEALLKDHKDELPKVSSSAKKARTELSKTRYEQKENKLTRPLIIGILICLASITIVWLLLSQIFVKSLDNGWVASDINEARDVKVKKPEPEIAKAKEKKKQVEKKEEPKTIAKYRSFDGSALSYDVSANEAITLKVATKTSTWIQVLDNNDKQYAYEEVKSKTMKIDPKATSVTLISGNSTDLDVYINDQKIDVPRSAENLITRTYHFTIDKVKED